jgi:ubiquinol-cytochrome c reductase cytochrome c1 subunit
MFKRLTLVAALLLPTGVALAEEGGMELMHAGTDISDMQSLQRGARNFMNYCSGCHSLKYLRYNRIAQDLQMPPAALAADLMLTSDKPFDMVVSAMPADSEQWFGKRPPDLSLIARAKGLDFVYSFLHGFYADKSRLWGVNNLYMPNASMPHVLQKLQGLQNPVFRHESAGGPEAKMVLTGVEMMAPGAMKPEEFDGFVRDLVNFLDYAAEPIKARRQFLGIFVILFLLVFFIFAYLLKKEYWKDVH